MSRLLFAFWIFAVVGESYGYTYCYTDADCNNLREPECYDSYYCTPVSCSQNGTDAECRSSLLFCNTFSLTCEPVNCTSNDDCTATNTHCNLDMGYCDCIPGYSELNGECSIVLNRGCVTDADCNNGEDKYTCENDVCKCDSSRWTETKGVCNSYYQKVCSTWRDCGLQSNTTCTDGHCLCKDGYTYQNGSCYTLYGQPCEDDMDCGEREGYVCDWNDYYYYPYYWLGYYGQRCLCGNGYDYDGVGCQKVLGSRCSVIQCGNSSHWSFRYDQVHFSSYYYDDYWFGSFYSYFKRYHDAYYCNADDVCSCSTGYMADESDRECVQIYGHACAEDSDCGGRDGTYICEGSTSTCVCGGNYVPVHNISYDGQTYYEYNNIDDEEEIICLPLVGLPCQYGCVTGAACDENGLCTCVSGFEENGTCHQVLGSQCERDGPCSFVAGAECGQDATCACREGFIPRTSEDICEQGLSSACVDNSDCSALPGSECEDGNCTCNNGLVETDGRCLREECAVSVPRLPDIERRSPLYKVHGQEPMIRDDRIQEQWYSLGKYSLAVDGGSASTGYCGTKYPVFLTESLTETDLNTLDSGGEVSKTTRVTGIQTEDIPVKFRKCGKDLQAKLLPTSIAFAAYCIESDLRHNPSRKTGNRWAYVRQELDFFVDGTDDNGTDIYQPYIYFVCGVHDPEHYAGTYSSRWDERIYFLDDGFYYTVNWYINDQHFHSFGPYKRSDLRKTYLNETHITGQYPTLGFQVRCSYQWSEYLFGQQSVPIFSPIEFTGFRALYFNNTVGGENFFHIVPESPVGCRGPLESNFKMCSLSWDLDNSDVCSSTVNPHPLCGVSVNGASISLLQENQNSWQNVQNDLRYSYESDAYYEGSYIRLRQYYGININLPENNGTSVKRFFRARFGQASFPDHQVWDGYTLPEMKIVEEGSVMSSETCSVSVDSGATAVKKSGAVVFIGATGEFTLMRSRIRPVEVQIQTESCGTSHNGVCPCGVTLRNGKNMYTISVCDDTYMEGDVKGKTDFQEVHSSYYYYWRNTQNPENRRLLTLLNGMLADIYTDFTSATVTVTLSQEHGDEIFTETDGLCIFEGNTLVMRTGNLADSEESFTQSWLVSWDNSLQNPATQVDYSWTEELYLCHCPSANQTVEDRYLRYGSSTSKTFNVYTGVFNCTLDNRCEIQNTGGNWSRSLLPDYVLTNITIRVDYITVKEDPKLAFRCFFDAQDTYLYNITWFGNDIPVHSSGLVSPNSPGYGYVPVSDIHLGKDFLENDYALNIEWKCAVSVHDSTGLQLLTPAYSNVFTAVEFPTRSLVIPRGGGVTLKFNVNMPLLCIDGKECYMDFKLYDEDDDYSCQDSTVAIKSPFTCGARVMGALAETEIKSQTEVSVHLTTKNNNKYTLKSHFTLKMRVDVSGSLEALLSGTFDEIFTVIVHDENSYWKNTYCYATNDPRMRTFDGQYYSIFSNSLIDEFVMMKHTELPVEVQMQTERCNWGWAACACGTTVRAGRDVFTITHCHDDHIIETLLNEDGLLEVRRRSPNRYQIYLPHGTMVDVYYYRSKWWSTMNIQIYPSPDDMGRLEGLCGNFNGDRSDDLRHRDGSLTTTSNWYWWWWWDDPDEFSSSWGLYSTGRQSQSLLNMEYIQEVPKWSTNDNKCVCPEINGYRYPVCSANEDQTCVVSDPLDPYSKPGDFVELISRDTRSTTGQRDLDDIRERVEKVRNRRAEEFKDNIRVKRQDETNPDAVNYTVAYAICEQNLMSNCSVTNLEALPNGTSMNSTIEDCILDVMVNKSQNWYDSSCAVIQGTAEVVVSKDVDFQEENPNVTETMTRTSCVGSCSFHGRCIATDECECDTGYGNKDCSVDLTQPPITKGVVGDGVCNRAVKLCQQIRITTDGCIPEADCKILHRQITLNGASNTTVERRIPALCTNGFDVYCDTGAFTSRRRRSTDDSGVADMYTISVSNDGVAYGDESNVLVIDNSCLVYNSSDESISVLPGFCLIDGRCYNNGTWNDADSCLFCNTENSSSVFSWTLDTGRAECINNDDDDGENSEDEENSNTTVILGAVLGTVLAIAVGCAVGYLCYRQHKAKQLEQARINANLYEKADISKKSRFKFRVEPMDASVPIAVTYGQ